MGVTNRGWLPIGIVNNPLPDHLPPSNEWVQRRTSPDNQGSSKAAIQWCNPRDATTAREFCVPDLPRRKERRWPEASCKSKTFKSVHEGRAFQDEGPPSPSRLDPTRQLDDQARSKGRLLTDSYTPRPSEIPRVRVEQPLTSSDISHLGCPQPQGSSPNC